MEARFNLIAIRVSDIERSASFYSLPGLTFAKHAHGSGPLHYSSEDGGFVFEIYPSTREQPVSASTRIGLAVASTDDAVSKLVVDGGAQVITPAKDSKWGRRAVVADPDGHRVELLERPH